MEIIDAAYKILTDSGQPLHYKEIADRALAAGLITPIGYNTHDAVGSRLYSDTLDPNSRFKRAGQGLFELSELSSPVIPQQFTDLFNERLRLQKYIQTIPQEGFVQLITELLIALNVEEKSIWFSSNRNDVLAHGRMQVNGIAKIDVAVLAKRSGSYIESQTVRAFHNSLKDHELGIIITTYAFTIDASQEAQNPEKSNINLIDGEKLLDLLIQYHIGAHQQNSNQINLDEEHWQELNRPAQDRGIPNNKYLSIDDLTFPLLIRAVYRQNTYHAQLLSPNGDICINDQLYANPTEAARTIVTRYGSISAWDFWTFQDPVTNEWIKIKAIKSLIKQKLALQKIHYR